MASKLEREAQAILDEEIRLKERKKKLVEAQRAETMAKLEKLVGKVDAGGVVRVLERVIALGLPEAEKRLA
jgi:ribulose 1,5-bisphosphate synthetase/thiazole synthase